MNTKSNAPNAIESYFHCGRCLSEKPAGISAKDWARTQTGVTADGSVQVWCNRHEMNVVIVADLHELGHLIGACDAVGCKGHEAHA